MSPDAKRKFHAFHAQFNRIADACPDEDFSILLAALAFQLSTVIGAMPDDFWVTAIANTADVTDAEVDAENAWANRLDALFRDYLR